MIIVILTGMVGFLLASFLPFKSSRWGFFNKSTTIDITVLLLAVVTFADVNYVSVTSKSRFTYAVLCIDADNGDLKWITECFKNSGSSIHRANSLATPTPVVCNQNVFAYFGAAGVVSLDLNGDVAWTNDSIRFESIYGVGGSPIVAQNHLIIMNGLPKKPYIVALNCKTGRKLWRKYLEGEALSGYSRTPLVKKVCGKETIIVWSYHGLDGYDPISGEINVVAWISA